MNTDSAPSFLPIDWAAPALPFRPTWAGLGNVDQFRWLTRADLRKQLALARDELGLRHVRACAMYSPELRVWTHALPDWSKPAKDRTKGPNWQIVDECIEGLLELGLKPIYTTCFFPADFLPASNTCWPDRNPIDLPPNLDQWAEFVTEGIRHHIRRFGPEEVRSWYFECWNEPNLNHFFGGDRDDFFRLWSATWKAVKAADPSLRFGGPSTARGEWIPEFLDFTAGDGTPPDYLVTHVYNNDSEAAPLSPFDGPASHRVKDSPHFASGVVRGLRAELDRRGWRGEVHWNEWGRSWFPHDPLRETALEGAFIVKTMAEVSQLADSFAFWCLSDIYDQVGYQSSEFQGHYGMLSLHGLRKPAWLAHQWLQRLGPRRFASHPINPLTDAIATLREGGGAVLCYAYPESIEDTKGSVQFELPLPRGARSPRLIRLGRIENNVAAAWRALGSPPYPTRAQLHALRSSEVQTEASFLLLSPRDPNGGVVMSFTLERPGVALVEFDLD